MSVVVLVLTSPSKEALERTRDDLVQLMPDLFFDGPPERFKKQFGSRDRDSAWRLYGSMEVRLVTPEQPGLA